METLKSRFEGIQAAFERMTQRDQMVLVGGICGGVLVFLLGTALFVSSAISSAEKRVRVNSGILSEVMALQGQYHAKKAAARGALAELKRNKGTSLVSTVEKAAKDAGVEIGRLQREKEGEPNEDGVVEAQVQLRASKLSIDRLQDFLKRLERSRGIVVVRRMKVSKPYRKETLDVELVISTYTVKS